MKGWLRARRHYVAMSALVLLAACASANHQTSTPPAMPQSALGSYLAARHAQIEHDYGDAARFLDRALAADRDNYDLIRRTFLLRLSEGRIAEAVPLAQRIVAIDGDRACAFSQSQ